MKNLINSLPQFSKINPKTIVRDLKKILKKNRAELSSILDKKLKFDWELIEQLDDLNDRIQHFWSPINHLHSVKQTAALREAYNRCLPLLSKYSTQLGQNKKLHNAIKMLANSDYHFNYAQEKCLHNKLRDFHLSGIDLPNKAKKRYRDIQAQLSQLSNQFEENVLDATANWFKIITDETELTGLPNYILVSAQKAANAKNSQGYLFTLDYPSYYPVLIHAENRSLRKDLYIAYITRASELDNLKYDNGPILLKIIQLRQELSRLLGFTNYAQKSLALNKMAKNPEEVIKFLEDLAIRAQSKAKKEWKTLSTFAYRCDKISNLEPWDILYYREKLRQKNFGISEDTLRCYFPVEKVLTGLFTLIDRLFDMHIKEIKGIDIWDPSVRFFVIADAKNKVRGQFYLDIYARTEKREGAWMDEYQSRRRLKNGTIQTPIAFLTCNFSPPLSSTDPALLTHEEVLTLFHEFGHGLQHMLTIIDYESVSGINGVEWDAVELPSQFLEYFAWEKPVLNLISEHYQTGQSLPNSIIQPMRMAKNFQAGLQLIRQLELALFDFRLHLEFDPLKNYSQIQQLLNKIRQKIDITPTYDFNRFQHSFSHIFAGGYAAGYYSYLWAEVLSCDAFSKFLEEGIFNKTTGQIFLKTILEQGGAIDAIELFKKFRNREPEIQPFLHYIGIDD